MQKKAIWTLNAISSILVINILFTKPSITGYAVAGQKTLEIATPVKIAVVIMVITLVINTYIYIKERNKQNRNKKKSKK
tara:strand:+ start:631 stop:867 length:237 start_codon:yes stop_codon:yes gene_type:complete